MDKDDTLLDGATDALGILLLGVVVLWVLEMVMVAIVYLSAVCWSALSELAWPLLRRMFKEGGIALLRLYNLLTSSSRA